MGRIMNRFSKDLETVDQEIAMIALGFFHDILAVLAVVVLITVITPGFLAAGPCNHYTLHYRWLFLRQVQPRTQTTRIRIKKSHIPTFWRDYGRSNHHSRLR